MRGAAPTDLLRGGRPARQLHPRRRGTADRSARGIRADPSPRGRARRRSAAAHDPSGDAHRGRRAAARTRPPGAARTRRRTYRPCRARRRPARPGAGRSDPRARPARPAGGRSRRFAAATPASRSRCAAAWSPTCSAHSMPARSTSSSVRPIPTCRIASSPGPGWPSGSCSSRRRAPGSGRRSAFAGLRDRAFVSLATGSGLRTILDGAGRRAGFTPRVDFETHSPASIRELVVCRPRHRAARRLRGPGRRCAG